MLYNSKSYIFNPDEFIDESYNNFKFLDIKDKTAKKYLEQDSDYKKSYCKHIDDFVGEIVVDNDKLVGYILVYKTKYK